MKTTRSTRGRMLATALFLGLIACNEESIGPPPPVVVVGVKVVPATERLQVGASVLLTATALDADGREVVGRTCLWTSSDPLVAQVEPNGLVRGMRPGSATITATCDGVAGTAQITIETPPPPEDTTRSEGYVRWAVEVGEGVFAHVNGVWGSSPTDVFAVGAQHKSCCATIFHYDGVGWSPTADPGWAELSGVWGSSANDVFAVGSGGLIAHFDGAAWSRMSSGTNQFLRAVWGSSATDVFAVGDGHTILRYDGDAWRPMAVPAEASRGDARITGIWGSSGSDVFALAPDAILHFDGSGWTPMPSAVAPGLAAIWGASASDVFAVGDGGDVLHYDGTTWSPMSIASGGLPPLPFRAVWGTSASDVFAVGGIDEYSCCAVIFHYDGVGWAQVAHPTDASPGPGVWYGESLRGIWGTAGELFVVGTGPTILHGRRD